MNNRKVVLYISMSLDGFIATENDDLSWLSVVEQEGLNYGYQAMLDRSDTYIVGKKTYDVVLSLTSGKFPQADLFDCYVITRQELNPEKGITFYNGNLSELITTLKSKPGKDIYCDGGGQIVKLLMEHDLIDEYIISVIPVVLGNGKRLFHGGTPGFDLKLVKSESFETGLVQMHYARKRD
ncbi:MAG: dihydrofolate reductase [Flavobacteriales bacterium]|nr:dihydrofolate reductase [Flavobacteriales bacterium]